MSTERRTTKSEERWNALLTTILVLGVVFSVNKLARRHAVWRKDFSEDQLYAVSDAARRTLARLEDHGPELSLRVGEDW